MKYTTTNNAELVIQAKDEKDYEQALKVAAIMIEDSCIRVAIASVDEFELWVHVTASWDNFQAKELKQAYNDAKKQLKK